MESSDSATDRNGQLFFSVFRSLCSVFGTSLSSLCNACGIQGTTYDMVSCTWKVLYTTAADQNNAMLLKVVSLSWDIAGYFDSVGKTYSGDLTKR